MKKMITDKYRKRIERLRVRRKRKHGAKILAQRAKDRTRRINKILLNHGLQRKSNSGLESMRVIKDKPGMQKKRGIFSKIMSKLRPQRKGEE